MAILLDEDKITRVIDDDNFDQIPIDRNAGQGGYNIFSSFYDNKSSKDEAQKNLICDYRRIRQYPKVDDAVTDIKNGMVPICNDRSVVDILVDDLDYMFETPGLLNKIKKNLPIAFNRIKSLLRFNISGNQYADDWYTDGCLYVYYNTEKKDNNTKGIKEIRMLDPLKLKLIKDTAKGMYYEYTSENETKLEIAYKNVLFISSGLKDPFTGLNISYLNKALRPINLLHMLENSLVVHRFVRAPERWVFKIDVSNMSSQRGKELIKKMQENYKSRFTIDIITGELKSNSNFMTMLENIWIPKTESQNGGHEIDTVGGNGDFGNLDDLLIFQKEVNRSLHVPLSRLEPDATFNFGSRVEEISRDEKKFMTFIKTLRNKFNNLFIYLLKIELELMLVAKPEEFDKIKDQIRFQYYNDNTYELAVEKSQIEGIFELASQYEQLAVKYRGEDWFMEKMLKMTKKDIKEYHKRKEEREKEVDKQMPDQDDENNNFNNNPQQEPNEEE